VAEWLRTGLQPQLYRFDSGRRLCMIPEVVGENPTACFAPHGVAPLEEGIPVSGDQPRAGSPYGKMAERTNALVLKTSGPRGPQGSNPCLSAVDLEGCESG
jgi:hypothetical protein